MHVLPYNNSKEQDQQITTEKDHCKTYKRTKVDSLHKEQVPIQLHHCNRNAPIHSTANS